jgi:GT2 family glycosyltransferase
MPPRLAVVIVTHDSRREIDACLSTLAHHAPAPETQVVVVDSGSTDGTAEHVAAHWPAVRVLAGLNVGFAAACNRGIAATTSELILLLNPDTEVRPGSLARLVVGLEARPDAAIAGPRIVDGTGRTEISCGAMLSPVAEARRKLLQAALAYRLPPARAWVERQARRGRDVDWVSGACLLVRRADAEAVGGLDERFFLYEEDVDFCAAVRARGRAVLFLPEAEVLHHRGRSTAGRPAAARAYHASHLAFYVKHRPGWAPLLRLWLRLRGWDVARPGTQEPGARP